MNNIFFNKNNTKLVRVNAKDIIWDLDDCDDIELPDSVYDIEVEVDEDVDPFEQWREDGGQTGFDILCESLTDCLSDEYGFCIIDIEDVEVIG